MVPKETWSLMEVYVSSIVLSILIILVTPIVGNYADGTYTLLSYYTNNTLLARNYNSIDSATGTSDLVTVNLTDPSILTIQSNTFEVLGLATVDANAQVALISPKSTNFLDF